MRIQALNACYSVPQIYIHYTCGFKHILCMLWFKIGFWLDHFQAMLIFISFSLKHVYIHYHNQKIKEKNKIRMMLYKISNKNNVNDNIAYTQLKIHKKHGGHYTYFLAEWTQCKQYFQGQTIENSWRQCFSIKKSVFISGLLYNLFHKITV